MNETHDIALKSWVDSANAPGTDFPIQNLPFGVFRRKGTNEAFRGGVAIGDQIVDLGQAHAAGALDGAAAVCTGPTLNAFMAAGPAQWSALRLALSRALRSRAGGSADEAKLRSCLVPQRDAQYALPATIGDYTDFFTSIYHATATGSMFRPDNPLLPNYKWVPIAYHGRSSSIGVSGNAVRRPMGQLKPPNAEVPAFAPSKRLDFELEMGVFVGAGNEQGARVPITEAESHIFGMCLLNDWSARDIQAWEYQPLGPFLAKNFASTISPWIVTLEALEPYRVAWTRPATDPQPLAYLDAPDNRARGALDIQLEVSIKTARMGALKALARTSFKHAYWTIFQMLTHHTSNGCNLAPGDLLGTGTMSGPTPQEAGSMLELSKGGKNPIELPDGETRSFIEDGDTVIMRAWCERPGAARIGFGECAGTVTPAG